MSKSKHTPEFRSIISQEYLDGNGSYMSLAKKYNIGKATLQKWVAAYRVNGINAFIPSVGNKSYSVIFKVSCVKEVLSGAGSSVDIASKYNLHPSILEKWIRMYNANKELKDYNPKREVYMAEARRKTTIEERREIVNYCINNNHDYKGTANLYNVSYSQVYSWIKKYENNGDSALIDKRGHHKKDDEVDELERLRRENMRLKRQLQESDMLNKLLKKVKEFERR